MAGQGHPPQAHQAPQRRGGDAARRVRPLAELTRGRVMTGGMVFYLGAHQPHWLWRAGVPLFVSHRQLARKRQLRPALARWALDSGGFTELSMHGAWTTH